MSEAPELSPRERAHIRRRDRKRETRMVVDNASIRRLARVIARRRKGGDSPPPPAPSR